MTEYVDIVDENNNLIGKATYDEMREKNLWHRGSNVYIFNSKGEILVTKRTDTRPKYPSLLEIGPGGALSSGETYEQNTLRELEEEVGIKGVEIHHLFDSSYADNQTKCKTKLYKCVYDGEITPQEEEVADYFWIGMEELKQMIEREQEKFTPQTLMFFKEYQKHQNH